ncbi:MAG TPA: hypothetical protein VMZ26_04235 [Pyrinomonadaceae bacterium]|nr:hypothetical protein [Pyrinomonadaceae bacterium]
MIAKEQNKLAGIFLMVHGGLQAVVMLLLVLIYGGVGAGLSLGAKTQEEQIVGLVFIAAIVLILALSLVFVLPQLIGGWKMLKERPNARTWGIIGSVVSCLSFPLGTAAGVFGLVFLLGDEGTRFYLGGGNQYPANLPSPPPPSGWQ